MKHTILKDSSNLDVNNITQKKTVTIKEDQESELEDKSCKIIWINIKIK